MLQLRNPHSVLAALEARPQDVTEILVPSAWTAGKGPDDAWGRVIQVAREIFQSIIQVG